MKQATLFVCAFAVLFQLYSGAEARYAADTSEETTCGKTCILDLFQEKVKEHASGMQDAVMDKLIGDARSIAEFVDKLYNKAIDAGHFDLAASIEELGTTTVETSYKDSRAFGLLLCNTINLAETKIITDIDIIKAAVNAIAEMHNTDEPSSGDLSLWEIFTGKTSTMLETLHVAFLDAAEKKRIALRQCAESFISSIETEVETTTNMMKAYMKFIKNMFHLK